MNKLIKLIPKMLIQVQGKTEQTSCCAIKFTTDEFQATLKEKERDGE